jgi:hypothetical protein
MICGDLTRPPGFSHAGSFSFPPSILIHDPGVTFTMPTCPKCGAQMEEGFIVDRTHAAPEVYEVGGRITPEKVLARRENTERKSA